MIRLPLHRPTLNRLFRLSRAVYMAGCICYYSKWGETITDVVHDSMNFDFLSDISSYFVLNYRQCKCLVCKLHR